MRYLIACVILQLIATNVYFYKRVGALEEKVRKNHLYTSKVSLQFVKRAGVDEGRWKQVEVFVNALSLRVQETSQWCREVRRIARDVLSVHPSPEIIVPQDAVEVF